MKYHILFDIDGTILTFRHGIAKRLFAEMLESLFKREVPDDAIPHFHGMTDLQIIKSITCNIGLTFEDISDKIPEIWKSMIKMFEEYSIPENITLHPGIIELIEELNGDNNFTLGLVTGNFIENAYLKLSIAGLDKYFPTGAFGCDSADRNMLPPIAIERANKYYKSTEIKSSNTLIIGDTFRDIECAKHNNIKVISVATGGFCVDELSKFEPDIALNDLSNTNKSLDIIYNLLNSN